MKTLIEGFSKVVGYKPFCKYTLMYEVGNRTPPLPTYEWDRIDPDSRYQELSKKKTTSGLTKLF